MNIREENLQRMAARLNLNFHIDCWNQDTGKLMDCGILTEHAGHKSEIREATYAEVSMWQKLVPSNFNPEDMPASPLEVHDSLQYRKGPVTMNAVDFQKLRELHGNFSPCIEREKVLTGLMGWFIPDESKKKDTTPTYDNIPVYISHCIPTGFFYEGIPKPRDKGDPIGMNYLIEISETLQPFKVML
jgi:hypothetical protein